MNCEEAGLHLEPYLRGDLRGAERSWLSAHLATCAACQQEALIMQDLSKQLGTALKTWIDQGEMPPNVQHRLRAAVRRESRPAWPRWTAMGSAVAAALVLAVFLVQVGSPGPSTPGASWLVSISGLVQRPAPSLTWGTPTTATGKVVPVNSSSTGRGVSLTVTSVEFGADFTAVDYTISGIDARLAIRQPDWVAGTLTVGGVALPLHAGKALAVRDGVVAVRAVYAPVGSGRAAVLALPTVVTQRQEAPVSLPLANGGTPVSPTGLDSAGGAQVTALRLENDQTHITLLNSGALVGYTDWTLQDAKGQTYAVRAGAAEPGPKGYTQELTASIAGAVQPVQLTGQKAISLRQVNLAVDLPRAPQ